MRVFLDTSVLVSAFATRGLCADVLSLILAEHQLLVGEVVLVELRRVLREKIRLPAAQVRAVEAFLRTQEVVPKLRRASGGSGAQVRDPDDAGVLASAVAGRADVLVTGDGDLLALGGQAPLAIRDPRGFWVRLRGY